MRTLFAGLLLLLANLGAASALEFGGWTTMFYERGHGTQIEYLAPNGKSYLWYPGNNVVLMAPWQKKPKQICYLYGTNTYNPVTGSRGGKWQCTSLSTYTGMVAEQAKGDVFGLVEAARKNTVPFVLRKSKTTIARLSKGKATGTPVK